MTVGRELPARCASCSKLSSSTRWGSCWISASTLRLEVGALAMASAILARTLEVMGYSKTGHERIANGVAFIHHRHPAPFVKGGAGGRNAQRHQVADLERRVFGAAAPQIGVLIVQAADFPVSGCSGNGLATGPAKGQRHGQIQIVGNIALAHGQNG